MKEIHISFDKLSDLCDNTFAAEDDREMILRHLNSCPICRLEYDCLRRTICLLAELREQEYNLTGLSERTIAVICARKKKAGVYRALPSIAATVAIIAGAALFTMDSTHKSGMTYSGMTTRQASEKVMTDVEHIVSSIRDNRGRILSMSEFFIEGEVSPENFKNLCRQLGSRKIEYSLVSVPSGISQSSADGGWNDNMEAVSAGGLSAYSPDTGEKVTSVRFRIFR